VGVSVDVCDGVEVRVEQIVLGHISIAAGDELLDLVASVEVAMAMPGGSSSRHRSSPMCSDAPRGERPTLPPLNL
jgi:hypothetical protein